MNIHRATFNEVNNLYIRGARWLCTSAYSHAGHDRGDVISWHRTHEAAARAAGSSEWRMATDIYYVETTDRGTFGNVV